jgi:rhodanese-related sulfurtransferase
VSDEHDARALRRLPRVSARETWERLERGEDLLIVDVRKDVAHQRVHIAGDLHYPRRDYARRKGELPRDKLLVLY